MGLLVAMGYGEALSPLFPKHRLHTSNIVAFLVSLLNPDYQARITYRNISYATYP